MIYLFYTEDSAGNIEIVTCPDEFNYLDTFYKIEAEGRIVPYDIHWHGDTHTPAMRILAVSTVNSDFSQQIRQIITQCQLWRRQN